MFREEICPHTLFEFPKDASGYPVILLSGVAKMTEPEKEKMQQYLASGGKLIITGPTDAAGCVHSWCLPSVVDAPVDQLFLTVPEGALWAKIPDWVTKTEIPATDDPDVWQNPRDGVWYHPFRISQMPQRSRLLELCRTYMKPIPVQVVSAVGCLCTMYRQDQTMTVRFLAEDYDVDIDHELDSIRFHRSRVNLVNKVEPIGVDGILRLRSEKTPRVYIPLQDAPAQVQKDGREWLITLPPKCSYAIVQFV